MTSEWTDAVEMKVEVVASTFVHYNSLTESVPYSPHRLDLNLTPLVTNSDELAEVAGRQCYVSWERPNPKTATNEGYLGNILAQQHHSVLEHSSVSFYVSGVSRSLLAELTRHRHLSFSVLSQRYVDHTDCGYVIPPSVMELPESERQAVLTELQRIYNETQQSYQYIFHTLKAHGFTRKESREAARAVLPESTPTELVVTGNIRAWREVLGKRHNPHADREIQEFAKRILGHLKLLCPNSVQDIEEK